MVLFPSGLPTGSGVQARGLRIARRSTIYLWESAVKEVSPEVEVRELRGREREQVGLPSAPAEQVHAAALELAAAGAAQHEVNPLRLDQIVHLSRDGFSASGRYTLLRRRLMIARELNCVRSSVVLPVLLGPNKNIDLRVASCLTSSVRGYTKL